MAVGWPILTNPSLNKTFDVALHLGTFVGAVIYFRHDIGAFLSAWFRSIARRSIRHTDERMAWYLVLGTIPGVIAGVAFENVIERTLGQPWLIAVMLAVFAVVLYVVDRRAPQTRTMRNLTLRSAMFIGVAQAVALQPGVSRSGITITAARGLHMTRESAARFSFLLALPIIGGAGVLKAVGVLKDGLPPGMGAPFFWGFVSAAVSGYLVIWGLLAYLRRHDFLPFLLYRFAVALVVLGVIGFGVRPATI